MDFERMYEKTVELLHREKCEFAICGGVAAMVYRQEVRFTGDIDILLSAPSSPGDLAKRIIEDFRLTAQVVRQSQLIRAPAMNKKQSPIAVIIGRHPTDKNAPGLDFLLPIFPWATAALSRAQHNVLVVHGVNAPFLTAEDVLLAKFTALDSDSGTRRERDWGDITSILGSGRTIDFAYVAGELDRLKLSIPRDLEKALPHPLSIAFKRIRTKGLK